MAPQSKIHRRDVLQSLLDQVKLQFGFLLGENKAARQSYQMDTPDGTYRGHVYISEDRYVVIARRVKE